MTRSQSEGLEVGDLASPEGAELGDLAESDIKLSKSFDITEGDDQ